jgi:hypothetical protein
VLLNLRPGDLNHDALVDGVDIALFVNCLTQTPASASCTTGDLDRNGSVLLDDLQAFVEFILAP